ncbi:MAG TPA: hypothetical protein VN030_06705 [Cellvibrio sp.]|nr:hypothetical protein [Cellvibrio sp.]
MKDPQEEVRQIARLFPQLKKLELWGERETLKDRGLSEAVGKLAALEYLHLVSCNVKELPESMANLDNLRELDLRGLPMNQFPEVVTRLKNLERLRIQQRFAELPESLCNLQKLTLLDLTSSLNEGTMSVTEEDMAMEKMCLKPIPDVIGRLHNLEDLTLDMCGVFDIHPIASLHKLKKLSIRYSALKHCEGFSAFSALEILHMENSYDLQDLSGLEGLPLHDLDISFCNSPSLAVLNTLPTLETLNISGCRKLIDPSPVYLHPRLRYLEAEDKLLEQWEKRAKFANLPAVQTLVQKLQSDDIDTFEESIFFLEKHVDMAFNGGRNPLPDFFQVEAGELEEITSLPALDEFITRHIKSLRNETLENIFSMTFRSIDCDHFKATLLVLDEVVARRDIALQKRIFDAFLCAMEKEFEEYIYSQNTLYTQVKGHYFPQFSSHSLIYLLEKADIFELISSGCLQLDTLFLPALQNTEDDAVYKKLIEILFDYKAKSDNAVGEESFAELITDLLAHTSGRVRALLASQYQVSQQENSTTSLLRNCTEADLPRIIGMLGAEISSEQWQEFGSGILQIMNKTVLPDEWVVDTLHFLGNQEDTDRNIGDLLAQQWHNRSPAKSIAFLQDLLTQKKRSQQDIFAIIRYVFMALHNSPSSFAELEIYRHFLLQSCHISSTDQYTHEIAILLRKAFNNDRSLSEHSIAQLLVRVEEIVAHIADEIEFNDYDLEFETGLLAEFDEFTEIRWMYRTLSPKFKEFKSESMLQLNLLAAIKLNDKSFLDSINTQLSKIKN